MGMLGALRRVGVANDSRAAAASLAPADLGAEKAVDLRRRIAPFANRPHQQRRTAPSVARDKHVLGIRAVAGVPRDEGPVSPHTQIAQQTTLLRADEAKGEKHEIGLKDDFALRQRPMRPHPIGADLAVDANGM